MIRDVQGTEKDRQSLLFSPAIIDRGIRLVNGGVVAHCRYTPTLSSNHRTVQPAYHISIWLNTGNFIADPPYIVARVVQYWFTARILCIA